jgi:ssDNA-binding Zn-finger/Zn-ribbon topoisomerase 1
MGKIVKCDGCGKNKMDCQKKKITKLRGKGEDDGAYVFCPECIEDMKWTQACLRLGSEQLLSRLAKTHRRMTQFSVTLCEALV